MSEVLLKTEQLTKKFKEHCAVDHVTLTVHRGEIYGFIGRNGAGKTTFLKMISGLSHPTSGTIKLFGGECKENSKLFSRIGVLIEAPGLFGNMSASENLKMKCISLGIHKQGYVEELLELVGLTSTGTKKTKNFSLGMKQRLGIAMALVGEPDLLVLDEPINGLDPQGIAEIRDTILKLNRQRNLTIIISSHILEELSKIASNYGIINNGQLIQQITAQELQEKCCERIEIKLDHSKEACTVLEEELGIHAYKVIDATTIYIMEHFGDTALINMTLAKKGIMISSISKTSDDLETYFLNMTGGAVNA